MADNIQISKQNFHTRLSQFITSWKADKRTNAVFGGVSSIVLLAGKPDEGSTSKISAMHVCETSQAPPPLPRIILPPSELQKSRHDLMRGRIGY
jgi:hypothetical protein